MTGWYHVIPVGDLIEHSDEGEGVSDCPCNPFIDAEQAKTFQALRSGAVINGLNDDYGVLEEEILSDE